MALAKTAPALLLVPQPEPPAATAPPACDELGDLAGEVVQGNRKAERTFLVTVLPHLLRIARQILGAHHPDVEDVAQEMASNVLDALPRYRGESTVLHFVCRVAVLTAMNLQRRNGARKRAACSDPEVDVDWVPSAENRPDQDFAAQRSTQAIRSLLDTLPIEQAETMALHCMLGYTLVEIAATAGVPLETVRSRLRLAKQQLRRRVLADPRFADLVEDPS